MPNTISASAPTPTFPSPPSSRTGDKVRITNRLTSTLKNYFPQVLQWFSDKDTAIFCNFLSRWPTLQTAQRARRATLERFFTQHHVRYADVIRERITQIRKAMPITTDSGVIAPNALMVETLVGQLRATLDAIRHFDARIAELGPSAQRLRLL